MKLLNFNEYINEAKTKSSSKIPTSIKKLSGSLVMKSRRDFRRLLRTHIIVFKYQKRDGSIRTAHGTLYKDYLPKLKGVAVSRPAYQMVYYDLEKEGWRSFRSFKFIKILSMEDIDTAKLKSIISKKEKPVSKPEPHHTKHIEEEPETKKVVKEKPEHIESEEKEDVKKKTFKAGDKIPEEELMDRSRDERVHSRKNETTHKANDEYHKKKEHKEEEHKEKDKKDIHRSEDE